MAKEITLEEKASLMMELREEKARLKFELDEVSGKERKAQGELLEIMENKEISSFRHKKFGLFSAATRIWAKITDFGKAKQYFEEQGIDKEMLKLKIESGRLNQLVKEMLDEGKVLPEGIGFSPTKYISVRKA